MQKKKVLALASVILGGMLVILSLDTSITGLAISGNLPRAIPTMTTAAGLTIALAGVFMLVYSNEED